MEETQISTQGPVKVEDQRETVLESQRARLFEAVAEVAVDRGLRGVSATRVLRRAGVSRAVLTDQFGDLESCFSAMVQHTLERGAVRVVEAFESEPDWGSGVLAGLEALLVFLDAEPIYARACLLETMTSPTSGYESRAEALAGLARVVDEAARQRLSLERQPPAATSEAMVATVLGMLRKRLLAGEAPPFVPMLGLLAEVVVAPYLGPGAACEAARQGDERARLLLERSCLESRHLEVEVPDMLRHRSAHRLRSCMRYLAAHPGASNKAVAVGIGVAHGGQVSAMLSRLNAAGLLAKQCGGAGRPNSWRLSPRGEAAAEKLSTE
ncbi:MAG TPA: TetR/AcrR family transcriptional regulator [Solirubrobacterales bacterium]|nr:TetR/AcrR family transcriptional regulator [Solirubrobacterales bacterium]